MACLVNGTEIVLTGTVGLIWWDEDHFTHADVVMALALVGRNTHATVRVNSGGGIASEGAAIHAALSMHRGGVDIVIEGWAASAASLLAMAGQRVVMCPGAILMIHDPSTYTWGTADEHRASAEALDALGNAYAAIYADKTGATVATMRALMKREAWLGPDDAVAQGFADATEGASNDNDAPRPAAFGGIGHYANVPSRIVALAHAGHWHRPDPPQQTGARLAALMPPQQKETPVTGQPQADAVTPPPATPDPAKIAAEAVVADRKRRSDVLAFDEAKGREPLAEHLLNTTDMDLQAIKAVLATAPKTDLETAANPSPETYAAQRAAAAGAGLAMPGTPPSAARPALSARDIYAARKADRNGGASR